MKKFVVTICLIIMVIFCFYNSVQAYGFNVNSSITDIGRDWIQLGENGSQTINMGDTGYWSTLAGVLTGLGIWVIIISGAILGIRFMLVDPDRKADVKKGLTIWTVGTVVIFGALVIWRVLITILDIY